MTRLMTAWSQAGRTGSRAIEANATAGNAADPAREDGFTLVEVLVAMTLFFVMLVSTTIALVTLVQVTNNTQKRVTAANLARQEIERLRGENLTVSQLDAAALTPTLDGTTYTVTPTLNPGATVSCTPGSSRQVTVVVSWNGTSARNVRYDTVLAC